jgi:eukaryotic-like serine/threonine-protein kinase
MRTNLTYSAAVSPIPGERVGPYDIVEVLGAGGMGVVFRARDTRLGRDVALKTLPAASATDPVRLQRFEQEARATCALNHPNVLAVFDVGRHGDTPYLVTELLEGQTLRAKLDAGPLSLRRSIDLVTQVARGLAAVHEKGIVHRDLKPENLFVSRDGQAKILDFGVARAVELPASTGTLPLTQDGAVLGTAGYMSPEQVRGRPADARSDLFALGAIFYECVSGRLAFPGETPVERGYAILNAEPLPATSNAAIASIIRRCLEKSPDDRFQTARELLAALEASSLAADSVTVAPTATGARLGWLPVLAALLLVGVVGGATLLSRRATPKPVEPPVVVHAAPVSSKRLTFRNGTVLNARFSADGHSVIYSGLFDGSLPRVYAGVLDGAQLRSISTSRMTLFDVSTHDELALGNLDPVPENRFGNILSRASLAGGTPRPLLNGVLAADFAPDDTLLLTRYDGQRYTIEYPPGQVRVAATKPLDLARLSPDGQRLAFLRRPVEHDDRGTVDVVDLDGNLLARSSLAWTVNGLVWAPSGNEVWFSAGFTSAERELWTLPLKSGARERRLYSMPGSLRVLDLDDKGRLLISVGFARNRIFGKVAGESREVPLSWLDGSIPVDLSDDGRAMLFMEGNGPSGTEVQTWLRTFDEADSQPVLLSLGYARALSRDKKWALISPTPPFTTLRLVPTGAGTPIDLPSGDFTNIINAQFLPDGKGVVLTARDHDGKPHIYVQPLLTQRGELEAGGPSEVASEQELISTGPPSPDGKTLLAVTWIAHDPVLIDLESGGVTKLKLPPGSVPIQWTLDGKSVVVSRHPKDEFAMNLSRLELASGKLASLGPSIGPTDTVGVVGTHAGLVTPDLKHYLYVVHQQLDELYLLEGLLD